MEEEEEQSFNPDVDETAVVPTPRIMFTKIMEVVTKALGILAPANTRRGKRLF